MKKLLKKAIAVIIILSMMLFMTPVFALNEVKKDITVTYREITVSVDGKELIFTNLEGEKLEPFIAFDTVYVSATAGAKALGKSAEFDTKTNQLKIKGTGKPTEVKKNTPGTSVAVKTNITYKNITVYIEGQKKTLTDMEGKAQEPFIAFDTVYVPLTALAKALGKTTSVSMGKAPGTQNPPPSDSSTSSGTSGSVKYYSGYPTVPDFGAFTGATLSDYISNDSSTSYLYSIFSFQPSQIADYAYLLINEGFIYLDSFIDDAGSTVMVYSKGNVSVLTGVMLGHYVIMVKKY